MLQKRGLELAEITQSKQLSGRLIRATGIHDEGRLIEEPGAVNIAHLVLERR